MPRAAWTLQVTAVLFALWLALSGTGAWPLGLGVAVLGGLAGASLAPGEPTPWRPLRLFGFLGFFVKMSVLGGVDVARRAMKRRVDVEPRFVRYRLALPAGQSRTMMVSLVSLLPGTVSAGLDPDRGMLLVHALSLEAVATLAPLERRIAWLYGLSVEPSRPEPVADPRAGWAE